MGPPGGTGGEFQDWTCYGSLTCELWRGGSGGAFGVTWEVSPQARPGYFKVRAWWAAPVLLSGGGREVCPVMLYPSRLAGLSWRTKALYH